MDRSQSVQYALNTMKMEGFKYTPEEQSMWDKIASGELPLEAAKEEAIEFDRQMRQKYPERYGKVGE